RGRPTSRIDRALRRPRDGAVRRMASPTTRGRLFLPRHSCVVLLRLLRRHCCRGARQIGLKLLFGSSVLLRPVTLSIKYFRTWRLVKAFCTTAPEAHWRTIGTYKSLQIQSERKPDRTFSPTP